MRAIDIENTDADILAGIVVGFLRGHYDFLKKAKFAEMYAQCMKVLREYPETLEIVQSLPTPEKKKHKYTTEEIRKRLKVINGGTYEHESNLHEV